MAISIKFGLKILALPGRLTSLVSTKNNQSHIFLKKEQEISHETVHALLSLYYFGNRPNSLGGVNNSRMKMLQFPLTAFLN